MLSPVQSPVLTSSDLVEIMRRGPEHVAAVGRRLDLAPDLAAILVDATVPPFAARPVAEERRRRTDATPAVTAPAAEALRAASHADPLPAVIDVAETTIEAATDAPADDVTTTEEATIAEAVIADVADEAHAPVASPEAVAVPEAALPPPLFRVAPRPTPTGAVAKTASTLHPAVAAALANERTDRGPPSLEAFLAMGSAARWRALQDVTIEVAAHERAPRVTDRDPGRLGDRLLAGLVAGDRAFVAQTLADHFALATRAAEAVLAETTGEVLAVMLIAGGVGEIRATSILLHHFGERATLGLLQDLVALVERTPRRTAERLVAGWRRDGRSDSGRVLRQTEDAERREAAGRARESGRDTARATEAERRA